jgi:carboxymethylenebutenolidase
MVRLLSFQGMPTPGTLSFWRAGEGYDSAKNRGCMTEIDLTGRAAALSGSYPLTAYLARPDGHGPWPGVVMVHEAFGLDDVMLRLADRIAAAGYLTLAIDLYSAGGARRCLVSTMRAMIKGEGRAFADIEAGRQWLLDSTDCTGRLGVIGFCMGGGFALVAAGRGFDSARPGYGAAAVNYGQLPKDLDATLSSACPVVASYGARDRTMKGATAKLESALTRAGIAHDVKEYASAGHAFLNDAEVGPRLLRPILKAVTGMGPEPVAAVDAWVRIEAFFAKHLAAPGSAAGHVP